MAKDITKDVVHDVTVDVLKSFFANPRMAETIQRALQSYCTDPGDRDPKATHQHWVFAIDRNLNDEEYGRAVRSKVEAIELVQAAFAGMKLVADKNVHSQPNIEEAR